MSPAKPAKTAPAEKPRAYSYIRFSSAQQAEGDSLRRQTQLAEDYARSHGLEIDRELTWRDLGVSAFHGNNIEQGALGAFLKAAQSGVVAPGSYLLVESLDRVSRKTAARAANVLQSICYAGVRVVTLNDGRIYDEAALDDDPTAFIMAVLVFMRGHEESLTKSRRLRAVWGAKRATAHEKAVTAIVPGWLKLDEDRKPVVIEERGKIVKRIVRDYLKGHGVEAIARKLNIEGAQPFGKAKQWNRSSVFKTLQSPALVGRVIFHSRGRHGGAETRTPERTIEDYYPAVVSMEDYDRVRERIGKNAGGGRQHLGELQNILAGLGECPECHGRMTRVTKGPRGGKPFLVCAAAKVGKCDYVGVPMEPVERLLLDRYDEVFAGMPVADATVERELQDKQVQVDATEDRLGELMSVLERAPSDALARRVAEIDVELKGARDDLRALNDRAAASEGRLVRIRLDAAGVAFRARPVDRKRVNAALRELLEGVVVDYSTGYLRFRWRHRGESEVLFALPRAATA